MFFILIKIVYNLVIGVYMKVIYVVDSITDATKKINAITNKFGNNILYVVRADFVDFFKTYGYPTNAVYYKNLTEVIHSMLLRAEADDVLICYSSLKFNDMLLTKFSNSIGNKTKVVNLMPQYNMFEQMCNSTYNVYVKSLFKIKDSLISTKLQFIPNLFVQELLQSHLGNRLFELNPEFCRNVTFEDVEINKSMKTKTHPLKLCLISVIIALLITVGLLASLAYFKVSYIIILTCIILYISNVLLTIIFMCKQKFDNRFFK